MDLFQIPSRKLGFLRWEADVEIGPVVYSFQAWTQHGAVKKANLFKEQQSDDHQ